MDGLVRAYHAFVSEARRLRQHYSPRGLHVLIGLETEWIDPSFAHEVRNLREVYQLDMVVGSVHHVYDGIPFDFSREHFERALAVAKQRVQSSSGDNNGDDDDAAYQQLFGDYFDAQLDMLQALKPEVVGHFDLIRMYVPDRAFSPAVLEKCRRNLAFIVSYGGLVEVNARGFKKGLRGYPMESVMRLVATDGGQEAAELVPVKLTLSDDAHAPDEVGIHYQDALAYLRSLGHQRIYYWERPDVDAPLKLSSLSILV